MFNLIRQNKMAQAFVNEWTMVISLALRLPDYDFKITKENCCPYCLGNPTVVAQIN